MPSSAVPGPGGSEGGRVLVLDKDPDTVTSLCWLLSSEGFTVRTAVNGLDGLAVVEEFRPHVLVMDVALPGLDGFGVMERIADLPSNQRPAVVVVTGWVDGPTQNRLSGVGVNRIFTKPAAPATLVQVLATECKCKFSLFAA